MRMQIELEFVEPLLGTAPGNKEVYSEYVRGQTLEQQEEEIGTLPLPLEEQIEKGSTMFHRLPNNRSPFIYDYQIKGFFKDACGMLARAKNTISAGIKAYKKVIDGLIFVEPRRIPLILPEGENLTVLERPLRGQTAQGERITLARSEMAPAGTRIKFAVTLLSDNYENAIKEWLEYGALRGLGQWRNASWGRFKIFQINSMA